MALNLPTRPATTDAPYWNSGGLIMHEARGPDKDSNPEGVSTHLPATGRHCEERRDDAVSRFARLNEIDCLALLAMTTRESGSSLAKANGNIGLALPPVSTCRSDYPVNCEMVSVLGPGCFSREALPV